jgi:hypothetical protein
LAPQPSFSQDERSGAYPHLPQPRQENRFPQFSACFLLPVPYFLLFSYRHS